MPTPKEWAKMSKAERAAYADTSGGPGGSFSGRTYPEYGYVHYKDVPHEESPDFVSDEEMTKDLASRHPKRYKGYSNLHDKQSRKDK
jgi:hypothetical protein